MRSQPDRPGAVRTSAETFFNHYFKRVNPEVAASFTEAQRDAIMTMFGAREITNHTVEVRHSIPFGRRRFYLIFLMGPERRSFVRLHGPDAGAQPFNVGFYLGLGVLLMIPVLLLLYGVGL
jgi:hypothetical protein